MESVVDHRDAPSRIETWRSLAAFGLTVSYSAGVVGQSLAGRSQDQLRTTVRHWSRAMFDVSGTTLTADGLDGLPAGPCILASNHRSLMDPAAIMLTFPAAVSFVAKQELRRVPVLGRAMERLGVVFVDRSRRAHAISQLSAAKASAAAGVSVWMAVEGGRVEGRELGAFKKGPFHLATELQIPIVPTWIDGTERVLPPSRWRPRSGQTVCVRYGAPLSTEGLDSADRVARQGLMDQVREALTSLAAG